VQTGITDPSLPVQSLVEGFQIRCPNCEQLRHPQRDLRRFERNERYALELNVVYQCKRDRGGCGHVFSPGDQRVILAYLNGDLIPKGHFKVAIGKIKYLEALLTEHGIEFTPSIEEPKEETASNGNGHPGGDS
jgi:hypothetical protein